ncbi:hypothetical protein [Streptomyces globisporus]
MSDQAPAAPPLPRVLDALGVGERDIASIVPLTGGTYNTVTRVTLADGRDWVVKTPPSRGPAVPRSPGSSTAKRIRPRRPARAWS